MGKPEANDEHRLVQERIRKLKELQEMKVEPYPHIFKKSNDTKELQIEFERLNKQEETKETATVAGRIMLLRNMGKLAFLTIRDGTGDIQICMKKDVLNDKYKIIKKLDLGDFIGIEGIVFKTKTGEVTVLAKKVELLCKALRPLPEKFHGLKDIETRYRKRYLDFFMNPEVRQVFEKRAKIIKAIREFLDERGFLEVQTPILQPLYGGGLARPFVTKINAWDMDMYLRIAYEIYLKKMIVGGFEKIYDLSYCFRNEGADKTHNPEFTMMEIQWAFADYYDAMELTEQLWEYVAKKINGSTKVTFGGNEIDFKAPWKRLRVVDALRELADLDVEKMDDDEMKKLLKTHNITCPGKYSRGVAISLLFEELCEHKLIQPTHIIDHPVEICPLAKVHRDDARYAERLEPFVNGMEIGNCYTELNDSQLQRKHFEEQMKEREAGDDEAHPMDEDYIEALEYGLPPNCGIGIGVDRMVMLITGEESIRDVILFPTMRPKDFVEEGKAKETKIAIAVVNKGLGLKRWEEMNTVAHLNAAFAARMGRNLLMQDEITTKDDVKIKLNIQHAIMIKQTDSNKILIDLAKIAKEKHFEVSEFTREMIETTDDRKVVDWTRQKDQKDVEYLGVLIFGKKSGVEKITKEFKLYE